jgi:hypothetical protein
MFAQTTKKSWGRSNSLFREGAVRTDSATVSEIAEMVAPNGLEPSTWCNPYQQLPPALVDFCCRHFPDLSFLTGDAEPLTTLVDPGVGEPAVAQVGLSIVDALFSERARHDDSVTVGVGLHPFIDDHGGNNVAYAGKILRPVGEGAVGISVDKGGSQQGGNRFDIAMGLGFVPRVFEAENASGPCCYPCLRNGQ